MNKWQESVASREGSRDAHYLDISKITKVYNDVAVLKELSVQIEKGEFVSLLGPSGCGKTTLLRIIAGLLAAEAGSISVDGVAIDKVPAHRRRIGVVFQNYALFPHLDVYGNLAFGLEAQGTSKHEIEPRVREALDMVRMADYSSRRISELSGGQQQRIAVARALVVKPTLLLLDEPFSALDRNLRETMQIELRSILRDQGITSIFVTHDQDEALVMSDRVAVMNGGIIEHFGRPSEIYRHPRSLFTLEFVGQSTRLTGVIRSSNNNISTIDTALGMISAPTSGKIGDRVIVGVRPELIELGSKKSDIHNEIEFQIADSAFLGSRTIIFAQGLNSDDRLLVDVPRLVDPLSPGTLQTAHWPVQDTMVFPCP